MDVHRTKNGINRYWFIATWLYNTHHPKSSASCMSSKRLNGPCLTSRSAFTRPRSINVTSPSLLTWGCDMTISCDQWWSMINVSTRTMEWLERCSNFVQAKPCTVTVLRTWQLFTLYTQTIRGNTRQVTRSTPGSHALCHIVPLCFIIQGRAGDCLLWMLPTLEASKVGLSDI